MADRVNPHVTFRRMVSNKSSRAGARPKLIVVHATQSSNRPGIVDLAAIGSWFDTPASQASSHVCTDAEGKSARYVRDGEKAWHCVNYNRVSLGIEQIGFAESPTWTEAQERETARWIARWSVMWGIPIQKGRVHQTGTVSVVRAGVVRHSDLGALGGGHADPGRGYDLHEVLEMARAYRKRLVA